jgi:hypothetical protein
MATILRIMAEVVSTAMSAKLPTLNPASATVP